MEAEELRYEKEVLEWKLQEAAGSRYASPFLTATTLWTGQQAGIGPQPAFNGTIEKALQAKHVSIYPTMAEVCLSVLQKQYVGESKCSFSFTLFTDVFSIISAFFKMTVHQLSLQ